MHADPAARHRALVLELGHDCLHGIGGNRECDADRAARRRVDRRIDADHITVDIEGRAAGIAFVHRGIDLDEVIIGAGADVAATRRDDAGRHRAAEAERIADRDHPIADARGLVRQRHMREVGAPVDLDQRDIGLGIGADHLGGVGRNLDRLRMIDHVIIGHRIAIGGDEEARALAHAEVAATRAALARATILIVRHAEALEEALHRRAGRERRVAFKAHHLRATIDLDAHRDHGGLHLLDNVGKTDRALRGLRISGACKERGVARGNELRARDQDAGAERRGGRQQYNTAGRKNRTRLRSGSDALWH